MTLEQAFKSAVARVTDERGKPAILGKSDGTLYWVDPSGMTHRTRVWARIGEQNSNQAVVVDCLNASPQIDLPVRVDYKNGVLTVIGVDDRRAVEFGGGRPPGTGGAHAWLHSRLGPDPIYIEGLQYLPLGVVPSSPPDLTVTVHGGAYYDLAGDLQVFDTAVSGSTSAYVPGSGSHFVIVCLDRSDGSIVIVDGDDVTGGGDALFPEASVTADEIEAVTIDPDYWPLGVVLLAAGQTEIRAKDIVRNLRPVASSGGGGTPGGSSGQVQYNNGGAFGGDTGFTWNNSTDLLSVVGGFALSNTSTADPVTASMSSEIDTQFFTFARQSFFAKNDVGEDVEYVRFDYNITDETDGDEGASFIIYRRINGTLAAVLSMSETTNEIAGNTYITGNLYAGLSGNLASITDTGIVFNSGEDDIDFRIAGNGVTNGVFFDASSSYLAVGTNAPTGKFHVAYDYSDASPSQAMNVLMAWSPSTTSGNVFPTAMLLLPSYDTTHTPAGGFLTSFRLFASVEDSGVLPIRNMDIRSANNGAGTVDNITDIRIRTAVNGGGGAVTTYYGIYLENQNVASTNYGIYQLGSGVQNVFQGSAAFGSPSGGNPGAGAIAIDAHINFDEMSSTPSSPTAGTMCNVYMKADKLVIQYNDGGTVRYKYLSLTGTGVTWVHTTTAP